MNSGEYVLKDEGEGMEGELGKGSVMSDEWEELEVVERKMMGKEVGKVKEGGGGIGRLKVEG